VDCLGFQWLRSRNATCDVSMRLFIARLDLSEILTN
jgi:hypothetical protein